MVTALVVAIGLIYAVSALGSPVKRVCVIGSGIAGLGAAACLKQLNNEKLEQVVVFEARDNFLQARLGGGVQLSGGSAVIERIGYLKELDQAAEVLHTITSRNRNGDTLIKLDVSKLIRDNAPKELCAAGGAGDPMIYSIMRDSLLSILYGATKTKKNALAGAAQSCNVVIKNNKQAVSVIEDRMTQKIAVHFADGTSEGDFDLVIGADGISSTVKQFTEYGEQTVLSLLPAKGTTTARAPSPLQPGTGGVKSVDSKYTGIRITYCVTPPPTGNVKKAVAGGAEGEGAAIDLSSLRLDGRGAFNQWLGDGCYALAASYGGLQGRQHMLAVVYRDDNNALYGDNADWREEASVKNRDMILSRLTKAGFGGNKELTSIVNACNLPGGRFFDLGVKDTTIPLKSWASRSGRIMLIGDSAHPMAPFLGQGANQALQDAYCLARLISEHNTGGSSSGEQLQQVAGAYERIRKVPTALLSVKSNILGNIETLSSPAGVLFKDNFFRVLGVVGVVKKEYLEGAIPKF
jgi:salicylate hydroxylase